MWSVSDSPKVIQPTRSTSSSPNQKALMGFRVCQSMSEHQLEPYTQEHIECQRTKSWQCELDSLYIRISIVEPRVMHCSRHLYLPLTTIEFQARKQSLIQYFAWLLEISHTTSIFGTWQLGSLARTRDAPTSSTPALTLPHHAHLTLNPPSPVQCPPQLMKRPSGSQRISPLALFVFSLTCCGAGNS